MSEGKGDRRGKPVDAMGEQECRCACGSLLARYRGKMIELKCRRCKRVVVIDASGAEPVIRNL